MCFFSLFTPSWIVIPFDVGCYVIHPRVQLPHMDLGLDRTVSSQGSWSHDSITRIDLSSNWPCAGASPWWIWVHVYSSLLWIAKWWVVFRLPRREGSEFLVRLWVGAPRSRAVAMMIYNAKEDVISRTTQCGIVKLCSWSVKKRGLKEQYEASAHAQMSIEV